MKAFSFFLFFVLLTFILAAIASAGNLYDDQHLLITLDTVERMQDTDTRDVIVWLKDNQYTSSSYQENLAIKMDAIRGIQNSVLTTVPSEDFELVHQYQTVNGFSGKASKNGLEILLKNLNVAKVFSDPMLHVDLAESRQLINAFDSEFFGASGNGRTVCVVDSGVDYTHPNLGGCFGTGCKVKGGYDFIDNDADPMDDLGHGTHVTGIVANTNAINRGIAPDATIVAVKVCNSGNACPGSAMIAGLDWCTANKAAYGVDVVTMSIGDGGNYPGGSACPTWMDVSIDNSYNAGIFLDAASGNNGYTTGVSYPACSPNVASVGAVYDANVGVQSWCTNTGCTSTCTDSTTQADQITCFTNRGSNLDILAPGAIIKSTASTQGTMCGAPNGGIQICAGTSMAAPMVAGAALLLREEVPSMTPAQIEINLKNSGTLIFDSASGLTFPRVDAISGLVCK